MNKEEQKLYVLREWKASRGERITKMLRRYWGLERKENKTGVTSEEIDKIFN